MSLDSPSRVLVLCRTVAGDWVFECYYLCRPKLVIDVLRIVGRNEKVVKRTSADLQADKARLAAALAKKASREKTSRKSMDAKPRPRRRAARAK